MKTATPHLRRFTCRLVLPLLWLLSTAFFSPSTGFYALAAPQGDATWVAGETSVSDLSEADKARLVGLQPEDLPEAATTTLGIGRALLAAPTAAQVPDRLDWRNVEGGDYVTPPRHQGLCGACWAFAGIGALESRVMLETHQPGLNLDLAEQTLLSCDTTGGCSGGSGAAAAYYLQEYGATTEDCQPYRTNDTEPCQEDCARTYAISGYQRILPVAYPQPTPTSTEMIEILKAHLVQYGPLWTSMEVYDEFYDYREGIYTLTDTPGAYRGGHAILLIGFDDAQAAFMVKNSWGTHWGEAGFFRIAYSEVDSAVQFGAYTYTYGDPVNMGWEPPTAEAGANMRVAEGQAVSLDGTASSDPDGTIEGHQWRQLSGLGVALTAGDTARPSFTAPELTTPADAELTFELTVTDNHGLTASDRVTVTVTWSNDPPTAVAGDDQDVAEGTPVTLDGTASHDPEGEQLGYDWVQLSGPPVSLDRADAARPRFTTPDLTAAADVDLVFRLTVSDPHGAADTDTVTISVDWANNPPVAQAGQDRTVAEGAAVELDGSGSRDGEEETLTFQWTQVSGPSVTLNDADTDRAGFMAPNLTSATDARLVFELTVSDPRGGQDSDQVAVTVRWENDAPTAAAGVDQAVSAGERVYLDGTASGDPDDGIHQYAWVQTSGPSVTLSTPDAAQAHFDAPPNETGAPLMLRFELQVVDAGGRSARDSVDISVRPQTTPAEDDPTPPPDQQTPPEPESEPPPEDDARNQGPSDNGSSGGGGGCFIRLSSGW